MDLFKMLQEQMSGDLIQNLSQQVGANEQQTAQAAQGIFGALIGGLANNASTPAGLGALSSALDKDHDGSIMDDLLGLINGTAPVNPRAANGNGIIKHVLGGNQDQVAQQISQSSGLNMNQIMKLMPIIAPIVLGLLGKLRSNNQQNSGGGMMDIAQILMGSAQSAQSGGLGNILGTVLGGVLNNQQAQQQQQQQQQGSGGLLGDLFGKIFGR
ncbi:MAG: DUF937 domain-containing protein [Saprospiraceae bacterium]|nr:DUF937 domain-containing protein [Saprospiraceae bacterium]